MKKNKAGILVPEPHGHVNGTMQPMAANQDPPELPDDAPIATTWGEFRAMLEHGIAEANEEFRQIFNSTEEENARLAEDNASLRQQVKSLEAQVNALSSCAGPD